MYYGHLGHSKFVPIIKSYRRKGKGFVALVVNEQTNYSKEVSFSELNKMLNALHYGYRVSKSVANQIRAENPHLLPPLLYRVWNDIRLGLCFVE